MIKFWLYCLLIFCFFSLPVQAETVTVAQVTDVHLGCGKTGDPEEAARHLVAAIKAINAREDVDFVVFSGDNIDKSNVRDLTSFCEYAQHVNKPYYIIMGNHDAHKIGGIPKDTYMNFVHLTDKYQKSKEANFKFPINNELEAVFVDGVVPNIPSSHGYFSDDTIKWLKKTLKENKRKKVIVFQHFPVLPPREEKDRTVLHVDDYNNLLLLNSNVLVIASGHYHQERVQVDENGITHVSTPSLLSEGRFAIIKISYDKTLWCRPKHFKVDVNFQDVAK